MASAKKKIVVWGFDLGELGEQCWQPKQIEANSTRKRVQVKDVHIAQLVQYMYFEISETLCIICIMPCLICSFFIFYDPIWSVGGVWSHGPLLCMRLLLPALRSPFILSKAKQDQSSHQSTNFLCFLSRAVIVCRAVNSVIEQSNENRMKIEWNPGFLWFLNILHTPQLTQLPLYLFLNFLTSLKHLPCRPSFLLFYVFSPLLRFFPFSFPSVALPRTRSARAASTASAVTTKLLSGRGAKTTPTDVAEASWVRKTPEKITQRKTGRSRWASLEQFKWFGGSGMVGIEVFKVTWLAHKLLTTSQGTKVIPLIPRGDTFWKELTSVPQMLIVMCVLV